MFRQIAGHECGYQKSKECDPVLWIRDRKGSDRRKEVKVEGSSRPQGQDYRITQTPIGGDKKDRYQKGQRYSRWVSVQPKIDRRNDANRYDNKAKTDSLGSSMASHFCIVRWGYGDAVNDGGLVTKTSEEWLTEISPEKSKGTFKLFLGYAPGVGKTYSMFSEAIRRGSRGEDVAIGVVESHGRKGVAELSSRLDQIPLRKLDFKGTVFEEMDVDAILARKPGIVLADELAHSNIEGSRHNKRFEDLMDLLEARIDVLSTMNVQHIESLGPTVLQITGVQIRETVPDWVMQRVDEVQLVDLTPQALKERMSRGDIYPTDRAERALSHFFRPGNLIALRELALRQVTQVVDHSLDAYLKENGTQPTEGVLERIGVCINTQSRRSISDCSRLAHGSGYGRRVVRFLHGSRQTTGAG